MDDVSAKILGDGANGTPMVFKLTGNVYDGSGNLLPNHAIKADLIYWQLDNGVSTKYTDTVHFSTGIAGTYVYWYKGQSNPVPLWQAAKGIAVTVSNDQTGWGTTTVGEYNNEPTGASPITIVVSDCHLRQM